MVSRKLRVVGSLLLAVAVGGCNACETDVRGVGTPRLVSSPAYAGEEVVVDLGGTGWSNPWEPDICPTRVQANLTGVGTQPVGARVTARQVGAECRLNPVQLRFVPSLPAGVDRVSTALAYRLTFNEPERWQSYYATGVYRFDIVRRPAAGRQTNDPPNASFTVEPARPTAGRPATFDASASSDSDGRITSWAWDLDGDGTYERTSDGPQIQHTYTSAMQRRVELRVTDDRGAVAAGVRDVTVVGEAGPAASFTVMPERPQMNEDTTFDASGTTDPNGDAVTEYRWDFGDGTDPQVTTQRVITHRFESTGDFTVRLTAVDSTGRTGPRADVTVKVDPAAATGLARAAAQQRRVHAMAGPFTLRVRGRLVARGRIAREGRVLRARGLITAGTATGTLPAALMRRAPAGLSAFRSLRWVGRFDATAPVTARVEDARGSGHVLAVSARSPRTSVCLRVTGDARGEAGGRFTVLGGTGTARRLVASGGFGRRDLLRARTARRARPLPRACSSLRRLIGRGRPTVPDPAPGR